MTSPEIHFQWRLRWPLGLLVLLAVAAVLLPHTVWNSLLLGLGGLYLVAWRWTRQLGQSLRGERTLRSGWVAVGDELEEKFALVNHTSWPALWVEMVDEANVPGYQAHSVQTVDGHGRQAWRRTAVCLQRGHFKLGPWRLRTGDPFGLFQVEICYPTVAELIIHPPVQSNFHIPLPAGQRSGRARARQRSLRATVNAASIRPYVTGDPERWVHWPTTARRDELFVRQFDLDASGDIWILLDLAADVQVGTGLHGTEEHAVLLAATLTAQTLSQHRGVGLASYGDEPRLILPVRGEGQSWRMLRTLALVTAVGKTPLPEALRDLQRIAKPGTAVIIITPNLDDDSLPHLLNLAHKGVLPHILLFDRASFGDPHATPHAAEAFKRTLTSMGFDAAVIQQGDIRQPEDLLRPRTSWRVTPLGKAIRVQND